MTNCPLYNGSNLNFTGSENPYGLIQKAGKKRSRRNKSKRKCGERERKRKSRCKSRKNRR